jgi:hypothetical protein
MPEIFYWRGPGYYISQRSDQMMETFRILNLDCDQNEATNAALLYGCRKVFRHEEMPKSDPGLLLVIGRVSPFEGE